MSCTLTENKEEILKGIAQRKNTAGFWSWTRIDESIDAVMKEFTDDPDRDKIIYLFSDGKPSNEKKAYASAQNAIDAGVLIYTLGLGTAGRDFMQRVAEIGGGTYVEADTNANIAECMEELLGDIFNIAGKNIKLTMTPGMGVTLVENADNNANVSVVNGDNGEITIQYESDYISVGSDVEIPIVLKIENISGKDNITLLKNIKFTYTNENDETVEIDLDDIIVDVINNISSVVPDEVIEDDDIDEEKTVVITENNESNILSHNKPEEKETQNNPLITGSVSITDNKLFVGDKVVADVDLENMQNDAVSELNTRIVLIDKNNESNVSIVEEKIALSGNDIIRGQLEIETENLYEGEYIAVLMADINGEMVPLDAKGVILVEHRYTFMVMADKGGNVSDVNGEYKAGEVITVSANAEDGFVFDRWESQDLEIEFDQTNKSEIEIVMPERAVTLTAIFAEKKVDEKQEDDEQGSKDNIVDIGGVIGSDNKNSNITVEKDESNNQTKVNEEKVDETKTSNEETVKYEKNNAEKEDMNDKEKNDKSQEGKGNNKSDGNKSGTGTSPLTGDFDMRDNIRLLLLIQSIALILICITLKKKEQKEEQQCH